MSADKVFELTNSFALAGWILLLFVQPIWMQTTKLVTGLIVVILCITYAWMLFSGFSLSTLSSFGTLEGVMTLFKDKSMVTAGWIHYLAFDLFIGTWICNNARKHGISHWFLIPALLLCFMMGPVGLLVYIFIRTIHTKTYFAEN